ncbi:MAG: SocA family protein [Planctomycetes bacterium]|nr:SocA family protein [Planctomycetota bacterium]
MKRTRFCSKFPFDEAKAAEAAVQLIRFSGGTSMGRKRLLKLMYLADRTSIERHLWPIGGGKYSAMQRGPVLSEVYNLISEQIDWTKSRGPWKDLLRNGVYPKVDIAKNAEPAKLSDADLDILREIHERFKNHTDDELEDFTHTLPEWKNKQVGKSSKTIFIRELLDQFRVSDEEIEVIAKEIHSIA